MPYQSVLSTGVTSRVRSIMTERSPAVATSKQSSIVEVDLVDLTWESFQTSENVRDGYQEPCQDVETATTQRPFHVLVSSRPPYKLAFTDGEKADATRRRMLNGYVQECFIADSVYETECDSELEWDNYFTTYTNDFDAETISTATEIHGKSKNSAPRQKGHHPSIVSPMYLTLPPPELIYIELLKIERQSPVLPSSVSDMCSGTFGQHTPSIGSTSSAIGNTSSQIGQPVRGDIVTTQKCYSHVRQRSGDIQKQEIGSQESVNKDDNACEDNEPPSQETVRGRRDGTGFSLQNVTVQTSTDLTGRLVYKLTCYTVKTTKKVVRLLWWLG
ncbi:uncharacterized protein LOC144915186 isoform X1 [Branchiostoma floridae x Branchiostoma belcheri]